jgi:hypothetical protein
MNKYRMLLVTFLLAFGLAFPRDAQAQVTPAWLEAMATDSAAWQRVITTVVRSLSPQLVRAAGDPAPQAWELRLPSEDPQSRLLEAQLRTILRARSPNDSDSVTYALHLGPLRIDGNTARVEMQTDEVRRCPGSTATSGYSTTGDVLVPRTENGTWGTARVGPVMHGDRFGCINATR